MASHERLAGAETVKASSDRGFGLVFAAVFAVVGLLPYLHGNPVRWWALVAAGEILVVALAGPILLAPANRVWTRLGLVLHRIVNPVVMAAVFYGAVTPTALVMRACGKDPLRRRFDRGAQSYWIVRAPPGPTPDSIKHQF